MKLMRHPYLDTCCITLFLAILLSACAPMTVEFYRPHALDGKVVNAYCPPVESFILIENNGVITSTKASLSAENQVSVIIGFEVPEGRVVILENENVASMIEDRIFASSVLSGRVWISRGHTGEFQTDSPMIGKTEKRFLWPGTLYGQTDHAYFWFSTLLSVPDTATFVLRLPNISVNDIKVQLPLVRFTRDKKSYIGSLNC